MRTLPAVVVAVSLLAPLTFSRGARAAAPPSKDVALAERVVDDVVGVKDGELVLLVGAFEDKALLSALHLAAAKRGGMPVIRIVDNKLTQRWFADVPADKDKAFLATELKVSALPDVLILVDRRDDGLLFKRAAPERIAAWYDSVNGAHEALQKRGVRTVFLGNGLFPTASSAFDAGVTEPQLKKVFEAGLSSEPRRLAAMGEAVSAVVPLGKELSIRTKAGTNLKLKLARSGLHVSDGVISADDVKAGGRALTTYLPAGEAMALIEPGSANGVIAVPRYPFEGAEIKDLTIEVKDGAIASMKAKPSKAFERMTAMYNAAAAGKELLGVFEIGLNADVKVKGKRLLSFVPAGTITLASGNDTWAGGTVAATFGVQVFLPDATLTVDGMTVIIDAGVLTTAPMPKQ